MLSNVLDSVLGTTAKVQILRALLPLTGAVSAREAQRLAGVRSDRGMRQALRELADLGMLRREEIRGAHLHRVNRDHHLASALERLFEAEASRLAALRTVLREALEAAGVLDRVKAVVLFGSVARAEARPDSDADLLLVTDSDGAVPAVRDAALDAEAPVFARLGLRISPMVLSLGRVVERYADGDPLMSNISTQGRALLGPSFHQLVEGR